MKKPSVNEIAVTMKKQLNNYYVDAHGCWIHRNKPGKDSYISLCKTIGSKKNQFHYKAHRVSYALYVGYVPDDMLVCHNCDVPQCINPTHLYLGTAADNMIDMGQKGRTKGHGVVQLTEDEIGFIIILHNKGWTNTKIAHYIGVSQPTISRHLRRVV